MKWANLKEEKCPRCGDQLLVEREKGTMTHCTNGFTRGPRHCPFVIATEKLWRIKATMN